MKTARSTSADKVSAAALEDEYAFTAPVPRDLDLGPVRIVSCQDTWISGAKNRVLHLASADNDIKIIVSKTGRNVRIELNGVQLEDPR